MALFIRSGSIQAGCCQLNSGGTDLNYSSYVAGIGAGSSVVAVALTNSGDADIADEPFPPEKYRRLLQLMREAGLGCEIGLPEGKD